MTVMNGKVLSHVYDAKSDDTKSLMIHETS